MTATIHETESWFTYGPTVGVGVTGTDLANMGLRGWTVAGGLSPTWENGKYSGGFGLQINALTGTDLEKSSGDSFGLAGWFFIPSGYGAMSIIQMVDNSGTSYTHAGIDASGNVQVDYSGTMHPSSPVTNVTDGLWHHWELGIGQSSFILWIDGMSVWSIAFINSNMAKTSLGGGGGCPVIVSDLFWAGQTGGGFPTNVGPARVECLMPAADGSYKTLWTPAAGTDSHAMVNDRPEDGLNTYIWDANSGDRASFTNTGLASTTGSVAGINIGMIADRTTGTPTRLAQMFFLNTDGLSTTNASNLPGIGPNGTLNLGSNTAFNPTYLWYSTSTSTGGAAWSIAKVNATEFGVVVTQ